MKRVVLITRQFFSTALIVLVGTLVLGFYGYSKFGRSSMAGEYMGSVLHEEKPQIDKLVLERIETATFALG